MVPLKLTCEIEIEPGGKLQLPQPLVDSLGPGHWLITVERVSHNPQTSPSPLRDHSVFLNSYVPEDEGLYDDDPTRFNFELRGSDGRQCC